MTAPLDGVRVLDFTRVLAGPHCTRMLADLGADVIKVEPPSGDMTRFATPRRHGISSYFAQQNTGKRNISLDLERPRAAELLRRLADRCDVVVENFRPGVMARQGLDHETLARRNPRLVYVSITGYGSTGPWTGRRAYAPVVGAETGFTRSQGDARGGLHANDRHSHADVYTALEAASAVLAALFQRERTGRGQWIDVSMAETMLYVNEHLHADLWDGEVDPDWIMSFQPGDYPLFACANGDEVVVSGHPAERGTFDRYMTVIGRDDLLHDPGLATVSQRRARLDELHRAIAEWASHVADGDAVEAAFAEHGLAVGVLRDVRSIAATEWAAERGALVEVDDRGGGTLRVADAPWHFGDAPDVGAGRIPKFRGEDNREVLGELLGLDDAELDRLDDEGVLSSRIPRSS